MLLRMSIVLGALVSISQTILFIQYRYLSKNIIISYDESLNTAINSYRSYRFDRISAGDTISFEIPDLASQKDTSRNITIDNAMYRAAGILLSATPFEVQKLDSILRAILKEKKIESNYDIIVFKQGSDSILEQTIAQGSVFHTFRTARKELDSERDIQVSLRNPVLLIVKKMLLPSIFPFIMLIVIFIVVGYQSKIIAKQKKIETIRQDFVDSMTHELRHPLQGALSLSEILENEQFANNPQLRNEAVGKLKNNLQNLNNLLHSLVIQSYAENLQTTANWQQGNLKDYVDEIITACSISNNKLIHFHTGYSQDIERCRFDPMHFPGAIKNLIENAIKYSGEEVTIDIHAATKNGMLEVTVKDTGHGIKKEELPHIFQKFYKGTSPGKNHGFGLGLSYVKWVCEIHGGQVTATSEEGKGSVFRLTIPNS